MGRFKRYRSISQPLLKFIVDFPNFGAFKSRPWHDAIVTMISQQASNPENRVPYKSRDKLFKRQMILDDDGGKAREIFRIHRDRCILYAYLVMIAIFFWKEPKVEVDNQEVNEGPEAHYSFLHCLLNFIEETMERCKDEFPWAAGRRVVLPFPYMRLNVLDQGGRCSRCS